MKSKRPKKIAMIVFFAILALGVFSLIVMLLWNAILPEVVNVSRINYWQALGILVLSKILFGGFRGGGRWKERREHWMRMREKWNTMTLEEREKFKQNFGSRCGWKMQKSDSSSPTVEAQQ
jgi:heme A synthase